MELIKRIYRQAGFVIVPAAAISAFFEPKKLPISIVLGGIFGLANLKGLTWGMGNLMGSYNAAPKLVVLSIIRLLILFTVITALTVLRLVSLMGLMIGFTLVFMVLLKEGILAAKEDTGNGQQ
ncbi:MAG: hypothetical protein Q8J64_01100 [Thermodesulfovibrionales bacterium]|nr:hypothetical protein [Thermodesulfovibrionales bacterium]